MVARRSVMNSPIACALGVAMALGLMVNLAGAVDHGRLALSSMTI